MRLRRYWVVLTALVGFMLVSFMVVEALQVELLTDPGPLLEPQGALAAVAGVSLLVADVLLPVASSVVMLTHGAMFGVAVGCALSLLGSLGAFIVGFGLGRRGEHSVERFVTQAERARADRLLQRWGLFAIVVTRPVPILAETMAFVAGASSLPWRESLLAALVGSLPAAVLYAVAGSLAASFAVGAVVFAVVVLLGLAVAVLAPKLTGEPLSVGRR